MDLSFFPPLNASLNALAFVFLIAGWKAIKNNKQKLHRNCMLAAIVCSAVFLTSYLTYHFFKDGLVTKYQGEGMMRVIYFFILGTHTPLATLIVPFIIASVVFAFQGKYEKHVKITKWLMPTWIYVSVTGVLIYLMLYVL